MKKLTTLLLALVVILVMSGCSNKGNKAPEANGDTAKSPYAGRTLSVYNWSYYIDPEVITAFEKKYGVKVVYDIYDSNEQLFAKLKAGATGYDIVVPSGDYVSIMIKEGMLAPIDKAKIPNMNNIDPMVFNKTTFDKGNVYSVPYFMGGTGIAVNKAALEKAGIKYNKDDSIFEIAQLKGKITLLDDMREVMGHALKALGYSVNTTNKDELEKAKQLVLKWKKNALRFDSESFSKLFAQGEVWVVQCYAENVMRELDDTQRANAEFFIPPCGGPMYIDSMCILKDSQNQDLAHEFINFIHEPQNYAKIVDFLGYPSINTAANQYVTKKTNYELSQLANSELKEDIGESIETYNKVWEDIRIKN